VYAVDRDELRLLFVPEAGAPDGITTDPDGRIYVCAADGVHVIDPDGTQVGLIGTPGAVNLTFGGRTGDRLFITTDTAVLAAVLTREGA
jgi:gluconolactonase